MSIIIYDLKTFFVIDTELYISEIKTKVQIEGSQHQGFGKVF